MRRKSGLSYNPKEYICLATKQGNPETLKDPEKIRRINADKDVCLTCDKEVCNGGEACFLRRKRELSKNES